MKHTRESSQKKSFDCEKNQGQDEPFGNESNQKIKQFLKESPSQQKNQGLTIGKQLRAAHSHATEHVLALPYIP